jgi:hypothetical protein
MSVTHEWMISAEAGWRALFESEGLETGRSRVIGWASIDTDGASRLVGIIVDPNDPRQLVPADEVVDDEGGSLARYGFIGS